jgi:colanic acid biosynthesis protein WcaH
MIPEELYRNIISIIPIICVDIIIKCENGKFLLVKRRNQPLMGEWWVVGGRISHGELARDACTRKVFEETGLTVKNCSFIGYYEEVFDRNAFELNPYHTFSLIFEATVDIGDEIVLDWQSSDWRWFDELPKRFIINSPGAYVSGLI